MKSKQSETEFNASLAALLLPAAPVSKPSAMHMNAVPQGPSKSLEEMLQESDKPVPAQLVIPDNPTAHSTVSDVLRRTESSIIVKIPVQDLVDSPWQPRHKYDETAIQALGETLKARGQDEPIRVRRLPNGKYQLIAGHRRTRAARLIGWAELDAIVLEIDDREAQKATLLSNETNEGLSDFERALSYQELITAGFATTQKDVARLTGLSQGRVSQCLGLLKLPQEILDLLEKYPGLLSYRHAKVVQDCLEKHPTTLPAIISALDTLIDKPELESSELKTILDRALESKRPRKAAIEQRTIGDRNGRSAFKVRVHAHQIVINIEEGVDVDMAGKKTMAALRQFAESLELSSEEKLKNQ